MILSPYFWLAALIAALVIFGTGYDLGDKHARNKAAAEQLEAVAETREQAIKQAQADQETAKNYEAAREKVRTVYVTVKEKANANIKNNPDYNHCSLDDDGLRLYNSRPADTSPTATGADSRVSGSAGRTGWRTIHDSGEQSGAIANVLRLPGTPQSASGVGTGIGGTGTAETIAQADVTQ